jgi:hypothetical protein
MKREAGLGAAAAVGGEKLALSYRFIFNVGGWLFPCADKGNPWPREIFGELHDRAERHAGLLHLRGGRFHAYRRKWATERKHLPLVDVMGAGGWKDARVYTTCYAQATETGLLEVMSTPVKLRERKVGGGA